MTAKNEGVKDLRPEWVGELLLSSFLHLFTRGVRGRGGLRTSPLGSFRKLSRRCALRTAHRNARETILR